MDHQVKIRGFRIDLGEIEAMLVQHPDVREAVVVVYEPGSGDKRLAAYAAVDLDSAPAATELRDYLTQQLPDYMVPSAFVMLEALPRMSNGKVDRRSLPVPDATRPELESEFVVPCDPIERAIANIWVKVLEIENVGIHDNFFELGGHSLLAMQIITKMRGAYSVEVPLRVLFELLTVTGSIHHGFHGVMKRAHLACTD